MSAHLATLHAANGVALRLNAGLRAVGGSADGRPVAELADGSSIAADAIVLGVGLTPNDALARDAGIACDRGVLVDERCRTSAPDVYAPAMWPCPRGPAALAWAGVLAERAGSGHGGGAVGAGPGRSVSADRRGLVGAIRRHGADRRLSGAGGQRGAARRRMPARCCRWRWMRKAAPWRA
ncbi:FAD-dependent oxidoreductase [Achromobacter xylosoxidans]